MGKKGWSAGSFVSPIGEWNLSEADVKRDLNRLFKTWRTEAIQLLNAGGKIASSVSYHLFMVWGQQLLPKADKSRNRSTSMTSRVR